MALASFILGIIALCTSWVFFGVLPGIAGIVLGIISMIKSRGKKWMSLVGMITSAIAIIIVIIMSINFANADKKAASNEATTVENNAEMVKDEIETDTIETSVVEDEIDTDTVETSVIEDEVITNDDFVNVISEAIDGRVGEGESITDVQYDGDTIFIVVNLIGSLENEDTITYDMLAETRFCDITDAILRLDDKYLAMFNSTRIEFTEIGTIEKNKNDIVDSEYGKFYDVSEKDLQK